MTAPLSPGTMKRREDWRLLAALVVAAPGACCCEGEGWGHEEERGLEEGGRTRRVWLRGGCGGKEGKEIVELGHGGVYGH